ncbi:hypothetical protein GCM10027440_03180 [Nocardiopsis coralliicola]
MRSLDGIAARDPSATEAAPSELIPPFADRDASPGTGIAAGSPTRRATPATARPRLPSVAAISR